MDTTLWFVLSVGGAIGFVVGRWWAEIRRARYDMDETWNRRRRYQGR